jgi:predicted XRE-type DNA-binding protein
MENKYFGSTWQEFKDELVERGSLSPDEARASELRIALIGELIEARKGKGISQQELEQLSGIKRPVISRMENGRVMSQIDTVMRVLLPLGKKLAIVPLDFSQNQS